MANRSRVIDRDRGYKKLMARFREARDARVKVGITASVGAEQKKTREEVEANPVTLVQVAWWNEYGTTRVLPDGRRVPHVPARSFVRSTSDEQRRAIANVTRNVIKRVLDGNIGIRTALTIMGEFLQLKIQAKITRLKEPANAPATVAAKGSSNPLIDIGQLRQRIRYEVEIPHEAGV